MSESQYEYTTVLGEVIPPLLNADMVAAEVSEHENKKVHRNTILRRLERGTFPDPAIVVGNTRLWTLKQIEKHLNQGG